MTTFRGLGLQLAATALVLVLAPAPMAAAADPAARVSTPAERQARGEAAARAFMMGRYDEALATYMDLYIQSDGRPEYLRNVGRCQQKLHQYPAAIDSFKEYLRRAKKLSADEKKEVQGFITEMQAAMANDNAPEKSPAAAAPAAATASRPAPAATAPPATPASAPPSPRTAALPATTAAAPPAYGTSPTPPGAGGAPAPGPGPAGGPSVAMGGVPPAPNPYASSAATPTDMITRTAGAEPSRTSSSPLKTIGIVSLVAGGAAAIGGTIALVRAKTLYNEGVDMGCKSGAGAPLSCNGKADSVGSANTISKILYVGAGVLGVAGVVMIAVAPAPTPEGRVGLAISGRF